MRKIKNYWHLLEAVFWNVYYGFPAKKLTVIGVTGTDGKTTTVNLIHHILTTAGIKAGIWSTISSAHTTTPNPKTLQKFLRDGLNKGRTLAVLEISSHAIDQNRIWGIPFKVGVLTNIADNEHLDYHKTFEKYRTTKLNWLKTCKKQIRWQDVKFEFKTNLLGEFNRQNCLSAIGAAKALGISDEIIRKAVASFEAPSGRLDLVVAKPFKVYVDFAHTPQAFEQVLPTVKPKDGRLIHVFGCTGDRDKGKRPIMGKIASQYDDIIILTHEDTYSEDPEKIINDIEKGITRHSGLSRIPNRRDAIKKALELAKPGDVVIITGVGHQKSLNIGGKEIPWSDQEVVKELMKLKDPDVSS
ncbi:MAG: UDP-N-acetylmuramoyl-L-alanyl-D-glutamate--2,6-diaminopimelate ligase [Patescibacteria group bacterium]